jgi:uncharacterized protein (DUF2126 family)
MINLEFDSDPDSSTEQTSNSTSTRERLIADIAANTSFDHEDLQHATLDSLRTLKEQAQVTANTGTDADDVEGSAPQTAGAGGGRYYSW